MFFRLWFKLAYELSIFVQNYKGSGPIRVSIRLYAKQMEYLCTGAIVISSIKRSFIWYRHWFIEIPYWYVSVVNKFNTFILYRVTTQRKVYIKEWWLIFIVYYFRVIEFSLKRNTLKYIAVISEVSPSRVSDGAWSLKQRPLLIFKPFGE